MTGQPAPSLGAQRAAKLHQCEAGERLRADYWFAHLSPRVTANWSALAPSDRSRRGSPSNAAALRDEVIAAKERVMRALNAVGPEVAGVLVDICCELKGLEEAEKANGWPQRAGKVVLPIALTRLARHYGLIGGDETHLTGGREAACAIGEARTIVPRSRCGARAGATHDLYRETILVQGASAESGLGVALDPLHHGHEAI
jgi:hypothetical protein